MVKLAPTMTSAQPEITIVHRVEQLAQTPSELTHVHVTQDGLVSFSCFKQTRTNFQAMGIHVPMSMNVQQVHIHVPDRIKFVSTILEASLVAAHPVGSWTAVAALTLTSVPIQPTIHVPLLPPVPILLALTPVHATLATPQLQPGLLDIA